MSKKIISILLFLLIVVAPVYAQSDKDPGIKNNRILLKIPYEDR